MRWNMMSKAFKKVIHETAKGFHKAGVMSARTMRKFDALCLPPEKNHTPKQTRCSQKRSSRHDELK